jgi:Tfp pilus assembly protein FimT
MHAEGYMTRKMQSYKDIKRYINAKELTVKGYGIFYHENNDGITLIELIITVSVAIMIIVALGFEFKGWMGRYKVENEIKQMYADFMNARASAMQRNRLFFADFPTTTSYRIREDTDENNLSGVVAGDTVLPTYPKTLENAVTWTGGTIVFDTKGIVEPSASPTGATLCVPTSSGPDYDCMVISPMRINLGKLADVAGACDDTNCVIK